MIKTFEQYSTENGNEEFDNLIDVLSTMGVTDDHLNHYKKYSIEFENPENDGYDKKEILDIFTLDLETDYEDIYTEVKDDIEDLYFETGLDPTEIVRPLHEESKTSSRHPFSTGDIDEIKDIFTDLADEYNLSYIEHRQALINEPNGYQFFYLTYDTKHVSIETCDKIRVCFYYVKDDKIIKDIEDICKRLKGIGYSAYFSTFDRNFLYVEIYNNIIYK